MAKHKKDADRLAGYTVLDGQFGSVRPEVRLAFPYFGETIRVHPYASDIEWAGFLDSVSHMDESEVDSQEAIDKTMGYVRQQIHPDDWDLFWATAVTNHQNSLDLVLLAQDIMANVAGFPTGQPDDSKHGRQPTDHLSKGGSSRQERRAGKSKQDRRTAATKRALARVNAEGRADIALALVEAHEFATGQTLTLDPSQYEDADSPTG